MDKSDLIQAASIYLNSADNRCISREQAISEHVIGLALFDAPLFAVASATDPLFRQLKEPFVIGDHFLLPTEWLPGARSVVSYFLPFSQEVRDSNRAEMEWPSEEWLHGRIEGQDLIRSLTQHLVDTLVGAGHRCVAPSLDNRFASGKTLSLPPTRFTSNWSERHVAYVCGLGTFGLSRGLITSRGMAGRFGSIVTDLDLEPDVRPYARYDEYCTRCGACADNCPVGAISLEQGKDHVICSAFLDLTHERFEPRYGCGKCQVSVPCEACLPPD